jgi:threonine/homoserine/homoserine lactone efflux protein
MTGFLLTLGDQKATLFYLGFFPAFVDLSKLSMLDILVLIAVTIVSVGGVKLGYAVLADGARLLIGVTLRQWMNRIAGSLMIAVGCYLVVQAIRIT